MGRPSHKPVVWYKSFLCQAASWKPVRRVVAKVEFHFGELVPRVGFIVTNLETDSWVVVRFYNNRGTALPPVAVLDAPMLDQAAPAPAAQDSLDI